MHDKLTKMSSIKLVILFLLFSTAIFSCATAANWDHGENKENTDVKKSNSNEVFIGICSQLQPMCEETGGFCVTDENKITHCECPDNIKYETDVGCQDICLIIDCNGHGRCKIVDAKATCECEDKYEGEHCEIDKCSGLCNDNGECKIINKKATCECNERHEGENCEIDKCSGRDCSGNGECKIVDKKVTCKCKDGYIGGNCEIECVKGDCRTSKCSCCLGYGLYKKFGVFISTTYSCKKCECGGDYNCTFDGTEKSCKCPEKYFDYNGKCKKIITTEPTTEFKSTTTSQTESTAIITTAPSSTTETGNPKKISTNQPPSTSTLTPTTMPATQSTITDTRIPTTINGTTSTEISVKVVTVTVPDKSDKKYLAITGGVLGSLLIIMFIINVIIYRKLKKNRYDCDRCNEHSQKETSVEIIRVETNENTYSEVNPASIYKSRKLTDKQMLNMNRMPRNRTVPRAQLSSDNNSSQVWPEGNSNSEISHDLPDFTPQGYQRVQSTMQYSNKIYDLED